MPKANKVGEGQIVNNTEAAQFELREEGHLSILTYRNLGDTMVYRHTVVPPALRGQGIAAKLAAHAMEYARNNGMTVVPLCRYVLAYIGQHPEYRDIVMPRARWAEFLSGK